MEYQSVSQAVFLSRPNRFIAVCELDGQQAEAHVKNTGRCRELLLPGATVYLEKNNNPNRRTAYSLIAVQKGDRLINMDSQAPNAIAYEGILNGTIRLPLGDGEKLVSLRKEVKYGNSRFDLLAETGTQMFYIEVKGVTLEQDGVVLFPDAPTERGVKHILELIQAAKETGVQSCLLFIIQMKGVRYFIPNWDTHPAFGDALELARESGVHLLAYDCDVSPNSILSRNPVKILTEKAEGAGQE